MKYLFISLLLLGACECPAVKYTLTSEDIKCHGADDTFFYSGEACNIYSCTWYCNSYRGSECAYVDLSFSSCYFEDDGNWKFYDSFVDGDGICD